jgi:hypothetical protein
MFINILVTVDGLLPWYICCFNPGPTSSESLSLFLDKRAKTRYYLSFSPSLCPWAMKELGGGDKLIEKNVVIKGRD